MATTTLTVKVDSAQFDAFKQTFDDFSNKITKLNTQFKQIATTIGQAAKQSEALSSSLAAVNLTAKGLNVTLGGITVQLMKWSTIVGSVKALMGMGGGLFGINQFASEILQRRRQVLGLGGTYGGIQAAQVGGAPLFGQDTSGILANIRKGLGGSPEELKGLLSANVPFGTHQSPDEILTQILPTIIDKLSRAPKGFELATARQYGFTSLLPEADLLRLLTEEGREEVKRRAEFIQQHKGELELSKTAQKGWTQLSQQLMLAAASIRNVFGEKLASLTPALTKLSSAFTTAFTHLMNSKVIEEILTRLKKWLETFTTYIDSPKFKEDLKAFAAQMEKLVPVLKKLFDGLEIFASALWDVITFLRHPFGGDQSGNAPSIYQTPYGPPTAPNSSTTSPFNTPGIDRWNKTPFSPSAFPTTPGATVPSKPYTDFNPKAVEPGFSPFMRPFAPPGSSAPSGRSMFPQSSNAPTLPFMPTGTGKDIPSLLRGVSPTRSPTSTTPASPRLDPTSPGAFDKFNTEHGRPDLATPPSLGKQSALQRAAPGKGGGLTALASMISNNINGATGDGGRRRGSDDAKWQMTRIARLSVHNIPGANIYMAGEGMST